MRLLAISDLHVGYKANREALEALPAHPDDWLIVAGDVGETEAQLAWTLDRLGERFAKLFWVPGNHELWTPPKDEEGLRGVAKYERLVAVCRERGVHTPEDPYVPWPGGGPPTLIAPLFLLYDYSFGPDGMGPEEAVGWAIEDGIRCADEFYLHPDPFPSRADWCRERLALTERRLRAEVPPGYRLVLVNHFPFRRDLCRLFRIPRFVPWCGTRATEDWHRRHPVDVVVHGHLHMRATDWRDGVRFEEVALGYPQHWNADRGLASYLRPILPHPEQRTAGAAGPEWHR